MLSPTDSSKICARAPRSTDDTAGDGRVVGGSRTVYNVQFIDGDGALGVAAGLQLAALHGGGAGGSHGPLALRAVCVHA